MKSFELEPTKKNLYETLIKNSVGRNADIEMFAEMLNSISGYFSIAIDGYWGSGKTFL